MVRWIVALIFLFVLTAVQALERTELPAVSAYEDEDGSAISFKPPHGYAAAFRKNLNREIQQHPKNVVALSHRAYLYIRAGNNDEAMRDFDRALKVADYGSSLHRQVLWSFGWALFDLGKVEEALQAWRLCVKLHGGHPFWAPYSFALAYWTVGERETALAWYSTAVHSNAQWGTQDGVNERTAHWRPRQKELQQAVFEAWSAQQAE